MKRLIIDASSLCWTALLNGKDAEFGREVDHEGKTVYVNSAQYGYENAMELIVKALERLDIVPSNVIFVIEGANSKTLRRTMYPEYKASRDTRPREAYDEFNTLKHMLADALCGVGACAVHQDGLEADDVIAYLAKNLDGERFIMSNDKDLAVLVGPDHDLVGGCQTNSTDDIVGWVKGNGVHHYRMGELDANPFGPFDHKYITLYIALVGDSSDNIPGAKGFGPKAFLDLLCTFGEDGLELMAELIENKQLDKLAEDVPSLKVLQKVIDAAPMVYTSYACAKLYDNLVNTLRKPLQWRVGMVRPVAECKDERLKKYAGAVRLVHAGNYEQAMKWAGPLIASSQAVALDIETSTGDESDEWLRKGAEAVEGEDLGVDVFGSELTSMGITFGPNLQYTLYLTVDHLEEEGVKNITSEQCMAVVKLVPKDTPIIIQNVSFELTVLYQAWGKWLADNGWHGFLPLAYDTKIMGSYVNENISQGLKQMSKHYLGYDQQTYADVTTVDGVRRKMNQLTAKHVLHYGSDDPICTAALYAHFRRIMEIEKTWEVYKEVEVLPAYLTALAYVQGTPISLERVLDLDKEDTVVFDKAWATVRDYLCKNGWDGTVCPEFVTSAQAEQLVISDMAGEHHFSIADPAGIKECVSVVLGMELKTAVRTPAKLYKLVELLEHDDAPLLAKFLTDGNVGQINDWVKSRFKGEPSFDINSPKQMSNLLYSVLKIPVRIVNKITDVQRKDQELANAVAKFNKILRGSQGLELTPEELLRLQEKASSNDVAIDTALAFDSDPGRDPILEALKKMKEITTRRQLYYKPYRYVRHWKDGLVHANANQCAAVTRRYSYSKPNLQQLPKRGEGVKFRGVFLPHKKGAVVCSIDFKGQELILSADRSGDANMISCYVGENKRDIHSMTAAGAMRKKWGRDLVEQFFQQFGVSTEGLTAEYDLFIKLRKAEDEAVAKKADDLRKDAKNVNFGAGYDAQAPKLAEQLIISIEDAQTFLEAKYAMFPDFELWKGRVRQFVMTNGYALTYMGARRHLADSVLNPNKWIAEKAGRQGPNFEIQGSAGEQTKLAMALVWASNVFFDYDARFIAQIHDELVFSAHRDCAVDVIRIVHECMTAMYSTMRIKPMGSISLGLNFADQIECGDDFDATAIQNAIDKCFAVEAAV